MVKVGKIPALCDLASAASARMILAAVEDVESRYSTIFPDLTLGSRRVIADQMRYIAVQVDCESSRLDSARETLTDEMDAVRRARAGVGPRMEARFPAHLMEGQDGD